MIKFLLSDILLQNSKIKIITIINRKERKKKRKKEKKKKRKKEKKKKRKETFQGQKK